MAKANATITVTLNEQGDIVFDVLGAGTLTFDYSKAHENNRAHAEYMGWKNRIIDKAALPCDTTTGKPATPEAKLGAMRSAVAYYESGEDGWGMGAGEGFGRSLTIEAIAKVKGYTYDEATAMVAAFAKKSYADDTKKALAFLRTGERVMQAMDEIRKSRMGAPKIDADAALESLMDGAGDAGAEGTEPVTE